MKGQKKRGLLGRREVLEKVLTGMAGIIASATFPHIVLAQKKPRVTMTEGVKFWAQVPQPATIVGRYAAWKHFQRDQTTAWVIGWEDGRRQSAHQIRRQDHWLAHHKIDGVDAVQFDPSLPNHLRVLTANYLAVSTRPFLVMYENVEARGFIKEENEGDPKINLDLPHNRDQLFRHVEKIFKKVILPHQHRYVVTWGDAPNGERELKAWIYFWNMNVYSGNVQAVFNKLRVRYPVVIAGGDLAIEPPYPDLTPEVLSPKLERLKSVDVFMPYHPYSSTFYGTYEEMEVAYVDSMRVYRAAINDHSPGTVMMTSAIPGFDDHLFRPAKNHPIVIAQDLSEIKAMLETRAELHFSGLSQGQFIPGDECWEGGVWLPTRDRHLQDEFVGRALLGHYQKHFVDAVRPARRRRYNRRLNAT